jgi:uncharacterized protein (DUF342 family)
MAPLKIHFRTMHVDDLSKDPPEEIEVSGLVLPGMVLVSLTEKESVVSRIVLEPGEHTGISNDGNALVASCYGYPRCTIRSSEGKQYVRATLTPSISTSSDMMEARLRLYPPLPRTAVPGLPDILEMLKQSGINHGVDRAAIQFVLDKVEETGLPVENIVIARGKAPLDGKDAYLRFEVEIGPLPGKLLGNGSIDFRERLMFVGVSNNQVLATKVLATNGTDGVNIAGNSVGAKDGKDLQVKVSDDTIYNEGDNTVRATVAGVLSMVNNDTIRVSSRQKIDGDIDYSTGNIRSQNAVEVSGSIRPDFMVSTKGNLVVGGDVQAAKINSHGNVVVKGGILGPGAEVRVQGDADINYIEQGMLIAGGNILIRSSAYYSDIQAAGNIHCPEKTKVVGGDIVAGGSVIVGQLGSLAGKPVNVAVGTDPRRYRRYRILQQEYLSVLDNVQKWYHRFGKKKKSNKAIAALEEKLVKLERELTRFNLIPGTPEDSLGDKQYFFSAATLTVLGQLAAESVIRIGNETVAVSKDMKNCKVCMDQVSGALTFLSL